MKTGLSLGVKNNDYSLFLLLEHSSHILVLAAMKKILHLLLIHKRKNLLRIHRKNNLSLIYQMELQQALLLQGILVVPQWIYIKRYMRDLCLIDLLAASVNHIARGLEAWLTMRTMKMMKTINLLPGNSQKPLRRKASSLG